MKILYLITGLRLGGAEMQLLLLADRMQQAGHEVRVVAMEPGGVMADSFRQSNIQVQELNITGIKSMPAGYRSFRKIVSAYQPQIVHAHMIHANLFARVFKWNHKGFKLICTAHNIRENCALLMAGYKLTRRLADWSTNVSREAYAYFVSRGYFDKEKSSYVPNAIDTELFNPAQTGLSAVKEYLGVPKSAYVFFTAGRLHHQKNHQLLIRAFKTVSQQVKQAYLLIAGTGPLDAMLKNLTHELGINERVLFLGKRDDMPELMASCDCFVLSSSFEGFGLVVGEAMAMQKPVVATDCGGVREVTGGYGKLVPVNNADDLARAMLSTYQQPVDAQHLADARRHIEREYGVPIVINRWIELYNG